MRSKVKVMLATAMFMALFSVDAIAQAGTGTSGIVPPYSNKFDNEADFLQFSVVDSNGDGNTWKYYNKEWVDDPCAYIERGYSEQPKDDWLFSPGISLKAGSLYKVSFDLFNETGDFLKEKAIMCYGHGNNPEAMSDVLMDTTVVDNEKESPSTNRIFIVKIKEDGIYYFGLHAISGYDSYNLLFDNFSISQTSENAPGRVADLKAIPGDKGALEATLSFKAPSITRNGEPLNGNIDKVVVKRNNKEIGTIKDVEPGSYQTFNDNEAAQGYNDYSVFAVNDEGEGDYENARCFVGKDIPKKITKLKVREIEPNVVKLEWEQPTLGQNGGYVDPDSVYYQISRAEGYYVYTLSEKHKGTLYTDTTDFDEQKAVSYEVIALTDDLDPFEADIVSSEPLAVGPSYPAPFHDSFPDSYTSNLYLVNNYGTNGTWSITANSNNHDPFDGDGGMLAFTGDSKGDSATVILGKVNIEGVGFPVIKLNYYAEAGNSLYIMASSDGKDLVTYKSVENVAEEASEWRNIVIPVALPAKNIRLALKAAASSKNGCILVDNISISQGKEANLTLTGINMAKRIYAGNETKAAVNVTNTGNKTINNYTVEFYRNDTLIGNEDGQPLDAGEEANIYFSDYISMTTPLEVTYSAKIICAEDQDETDNASNETIALVVYNTDLPKVTDLNASVNKNSVSLSWKEPSSIGTEQFEYAPAFSNAEFGKWSAVDLNGSNTIIALDGDKELEYPNAGQPAAFIVFNAEQLGVAGGNLAPHSGRQALVAFANTDGQNDGWLISPEVEGNQDIHFYAKAANPDFPEQLEVLYSATDTKPESFARIGDVVDISTGDWEKIEKALPAETRYFAIRCISNDSYALLIDDISYKNRGLKIKGYNVYRDGKKLNEEPVNETRFTDNIMQKGLFTYYVTALYNTGESVFSEPLQVNTDASGISETLNGVDISAGEGEIVVNSSNYYRAEVYTTTGILVKKISGIGRTAVHVGYGLYIVKCGSKSVRLAICN